METSTFRISCMPPLFDERSRVLILGTMPGVESLAQQTYYANPKNHFWDFMYRILQADYPPYQIFDHTTAKENRYALLQSNNIALWDIVASCYRVGSNDNKINDPEFNDLSSLLEQSAITHIYCNGKKSTTFLRKSQQIHKLRNIVTSELNSTSSLNPNNTFAIFSEWYNSIKTTLRT